MNDGDETTLTLADPWDDAKFYVGMRIAFGPRVRWWRRLWRWVRRAPAPPKLTVVMVDHGTGTITVADSDATSEGQGRRC